MNNLPGKSTYISKFNPDGKDSHHHLLKSANRSRAAVPFPVKLVYKCATNRKARSSGLLCPELELSGASQLSFGPRYQYWDELSGVHLVLTRIPAQKRYFCAGAPGARQRHFTDRSVSDGLWTGSWASYFIKRIFV